MEVKRGHALDCPIVVVSSVSRIFQGLFALYMLYVYNYNRTTKESKHNLVALARYLQLCSTMQYTMKNILYRLYIIIYELSKLTVVTDLPFAVSVL